MKMEQNTVCVDPMLERLEKWRAEKGRSQKPDKPWIPKFKKLHNKSLTAIDDEPNLIEWKTVPQDAAKIVNPDPVNVLKERNVERQPISKNLDVKSRRELLAEWKMQKKLREAELQDKKAKERRWTICGVASNQRRESTVSLLNRSTSSSDRGFLPAPKKPASYVVQPPTKRKIASKHVEAKISAEETTAKASTVTDKATAGTLPASTKVSTKTQGTSTNIKMTSVESQTTNGRTQLTARPQFATSKTQLMVAKAPVTSTKPPSMPAKPLKFTKDHVKSVGGPVTSGKASATVTKAHVADIRATVTATKPVVMPTKPPSMPAKSLKFTKDPAMTVDGKVTSGKAPVTMSRAQVVTGKAQLMTTHVPMLATKVVTSEKAPETNVKAIITTGKSQLMTGSGEMMAANIAATSKHIARLSIVSSKPPVVKKPPAIPARQSLSSLHRRQVFKIGHSECHKSPTITNKLTRPSEFKKAKQASLKVPWNSGTKASNAAKAMLGAKELTDSGILVKYRRPDGILKNRTELKSPKMKKSVAFIIPVRSPDDPPLNERLVSWLLENNHSPCEYRHLQSLGACLTDVKQPDFGPDEILNSPGTPDTVTVTTDDLDEGQTLTRLSNVLGELNRLLKNSFPVNQASEWLDLMYERVPEVRLMAPYWLCRARVSLSCGCSREDVLELVEHGIREGAQPAADLVNFKRQRTRTSTPRPKSNCQKENMFNSTLVRFKVGEIKDKIEKPLKEVETPLKVTPVRRSHRLTNFPSSESTFASVDDIPADMKPRLVLTPNRYFNVDIDSEPENI